MKRATLLLACAHALTAPPQLSELKSNLKLKLRKQQLLRATASQNVTTPRRYASRAELKDTLVDTLQPNPFHWTEWPFRIGSLGAFYLSYPLAWQAVSVLPPPNPTEGGYFFSLMSIVFGTLTASTISDATARLAALRAAAVEECTPVRKSNFRGASPPLLNHGIHAIDAQHPTHWLICAQVHVDAATHQAVGGYSRAGREQA